MHRARSGRQRRRSGFTLVELLIVIVAMLILAGIIIPQVGHSIEDANRSAMLANLHALTMAIERYKIDHDGLPPDDLTGQTLPQLSRRTDIYGAIGEGPEFVYGPYIVGEIPPNPLNQSAAVQEINSAPPANPELFGGWLYYPATGQIWPGERTTAGSGG